MEKGVHLDNIYKEVIKPSDFVSVQIRYLSSRQEGKISSKLYRNTLTYTVNTGILRTTKKSLTSTPKTLDCETPVNSEQLASPPSTPTVSTPNAVNKNAQESSFTDSAHPSQSRLTKTKITTNN